MFLTKNLNSRKGLEQEGITIKAEKNNIEILKNTLFKVYVYIYNCKFLKIKNRQTIEYT